MNENDLRVIKTKKALHEALLALLKTKPLEAISVSALCSKASITRGTFYLHYKDVGAVFDEHLNSLLLDLEDSYMEPYRHGTLDLPRQLDPSTIRIFHHVKKYQKFYEIVFDKKSSLSYYYSLLEKIKRLMSDTLKEHVQLDRDPSMLISYQANAIMGLLIQWYEEGFERTPEAMNDELTYYIKLQNFAPPRN
ncbi:TetR-like C-terminal domain-containing protein [Cohnella thailandensis]|uniref:TetR/AcrR family transcriptional regulator C-terminal domain-containing protein n=1 Tax=Cohnella thailandensis TaxID=557557 RepID=A0A841SX98_9BACL|nr:TetR-like C-terminal domain-containing protein [Cohnella thailandensis]MBB6634798.1 TetR/AcrR family transcriptional regulator C-terminal domain-containing protein [Cohnella thailandensis]MBP1975981.1 AcrR family transcriptional regulator [Cohnella thailandensis]